MATVAEHPPSKEQLLTALDILNNHPFVSGAVKFRLNTDSDPWTVEVLDSGGNVLTTIPPAKAMEAAGVINKLPPPGVAIDTLV